TSIRGRKLGFDKGARLCVNPGLVPGGALPIGWLPYANTAASAAVTATTTETLFDKFYTIPGGSLQPGSLIQVRWQGIATATNSTDTLTLKAYIGGLGGTLLFTHAAQDVANNDVFQGEYELIIRTIGSAGTMVGCGWGKTIAAAEGTMTIRDDILASTAI